MVGATGEPYSYTAGAALNSGDPLGLDCGVFDPGACFGSPWSGLGNAAGFVAGHAQSAARQATIWSLNQAMGFMNTVGKAETSGNPRRMALGFGYVYVNVFVGLVGEPEEAGVVGLVGGEFTADADYVCLTNSLASEAQLGEEGVAILGAGTSRELNAAARLAREYGGTPDEWAKMTSSTYTGRNGAQFETHWYQNIRTGERVEQKTKIVKWPRR